MDYKEVLDWMFHQLPMYQNQGVKAYKADLNNTLLLMQYLGNPEKKLKVIHVAGTNGKGSTSHMISSILQEEGYRVGLYTSPHLIDYKERIKISGIEISEKYVVDFIKQHRSFFEMNHLSFFEMTVGLAFQYFVDNSVDYAVIETGLGGRLDSTNLVNPLVSVITNIGYDHMQLLGDTLPLIASEKAGIIKENVPVVIGEYQAEVFGVFENKASQLNSSLYRAFDLVSEDFECDLKGDYQKKNIKTAVTAIEVLRNIGLMVANESVVLGLKHVVKNTGLLGRYQIIQKQPKVIADTAHNAAGVELVVNQLLNEKYKKLHVVVGMVNDKDVTAVLKLLPENAKYYFTKPALERGLESELLAEKANLLGLTGDCFKDVSEAYKVALMNAQHDDLIYVGGSTFVVADLLGYLFHNH